LLASNEKLAREIFLSTAGGWHFSGLPFTAKLKESDAADFLFFEYGKIPQIKEDLSGKANFLTDVDNFDHLRSAALRDLVARGSTEAVTAVARLAADLPSLDWLKYHVVDARRNASARTWKRREPAAVIATIRSIGPQLEIRSTRTIVSEAAAAFQNANTPAHVHVVFDVPSETVPVISASLVPEDAVRPRRILAVATEWHSKNGGISTLNRNLCTALASVGHEIVCFVSNPTAQEISDAAKANVRLVGSATDPVMRDDDERLFLFGRGTVTTFVPDLVVGHDHITGSAAYHIASRIFGVPYVHFIHTLPEEAERFKTRGDGSILVGDAKAEVQVKQCRDAQLVVAVGPRIHRELQTRVGQNYDIPVVRFCPSLDETLLGKTIDVKKVLSSYCLLLARLEDGRLKGADIACQMILSLNKDWT
jgi:hypothetical protein